MLNLTNLSYIPYMLLLCAILSLWVAKHRSIILAITYTIAVIAGLFLNAIDPIALGGLLLFLFLIFVYNNVNKWHYAQHLMMLVVFIYGFLFFSHMFPGFHNLLVFNKLKLSEDSIPFTMYLNFDKVSMGLLIIALVTPVFVSFKELKSKLPMTLGFVSITIVLIMVLSLLLGVVKFDVKYGSYFWIWLLNNVFFVSFAEEALFRGFLQHHLYKIRVNLVFRSVIAVLLPAVIFGLLHYGFGMEYVVLATASGIMYGLIYHKTRSIEMAILAHATVNIFHILFFTYPALARF